MATANGAFGTPHEPASDTTLKPPTAWKERPQTLLTRGKAKGYRVVWDPDLDGKLSKEQRKSATLRKRDCGTECRTEDRLSKAIWRPAPYNLPPCKVDRHSIGPGEAQQVVVIYFDAFLSGSVSKLSFSTYGSVVSIQHKADPETGSFLGIALIKYRNVYRDELDCTAVESAKRAEAESDGRRIRVHTVKVEVDREGRRFKKYVDHALKKAEEERTKGKRASIVPAPKSGYEDSRRISSPTSECAQGSVLEVFCPSGLQRDHE
ncbi:histone methyltransferase set1 [Oleoguttula sp. CCFEE 5521]